MSSINISILEFLQLEENARLILTDSGGLQEEGCILGTPCVTLRDNTERQETVTAGAQADSCFSDRGLESLEERFLPTSGTASATIILTASTSL